MLSGMAYCLSISSELILNRSLLLSVFVLCSSCGPEKGKGDGPDDVPKESVQTYFALSKDKELPMEERSKAINRALALWQLGQRDSMWGHLLYQKNYLHLSSGEYDSLVHYHQRFKAKDSVLDDDYNKARQYYLMGSYYREIAKDFDKAYPNFT